VGVLLASVLPAWLGLDATTAVLALGLVLGLTAVPAARRRWRSNSPPDGPAASPWADAGFRRLLAIFMLNGVAAAIPPPAALLRGRQLQPPHCSRYCCCFFGAAALGLPLWVKAVSRWGLAPSWRAGMLASVLAFGCTPWLGAGDGMAFAAICLASGWPWARTWPCQAPCSRA
jgi:hypothetical protein